MFVLTQVLMDGGVMTRRWRDDDMRFDADALIPRRAIIPAGKRGWGARVMPQSIRKIN